jgi:RNA polymerase primary sigma factor
VLKAVPREPISLDDPVGKDEDRTLGETISRREDVAPDDSVINRSEAILVRRVLDRLSPMEVDIIQRRFGLDHRRDETLEEIGKSYNLSRERVRQIQVQGLKKMEKYCRKRMGLAVAAV